MHEDYKALIDDRNEDLWREMNAHFHITLKECPEKSYITSYTSSGIIIYIDKSNIGPAPFTHELLHLFIKYKDTHILRDLSKMTETDNHLLHLFSQSVVNHISNCLEHFKMLPMYLGRNFDNEHFTQDFQTQLMDGQTTDKLMATYIKNGIYDGRAVQTFINKFFSMKASNNKRFDYGPYFKALSKLDPQLYYNLDSFWEGWVNFKIGNPPEEYQNILETFLNEMGTWIKNKTLIY